MAALEVRSARGDELPAVASLLHKSYAEHIATFPPALGETYAQELVDVERRLPFSELVVAVRDDQPVGTITFVPDVADDGHPWPPGGSVLRLLAVSPDARGQDIAAVLVREVVTRARERGSDYLGLHTAPFMSAARRLYERSGFRRAPQHDFNPFRYYRSAAVVEPTHDDVAAVQGLAYVLPLIEAPPEDEVVEVALPHDPSIASVARRAVREVAADVPVCDHDLALCTTELVTNALLHGVPPARLQIGLGPQRLRVSVVDAAPGLVLPREGSSPTTASGRGLALVAATASRWGVRPTRDGKAVWFELDLGEE